MESKRRVVAQALAIAAMAGWLLVNPATVDAASASSCQPGVYCAFSCDEGETEMLCESFGCEMLACFELGTLQCFGPMGELGEGTRSVVCGDAT
jgi:hypothetical protein